MTDEFRKAADIEASTPITLGSLPADADREAKIDNGKLWSFLRSVMSQGADIHFDHANKTYEEYARRLDIAANERVDDFHNRFAAFPHARPNEGWRPIAEAPKDGAEVLLCGGVIVYPSSEHSPSPLTWTTYGEWTTAGFRPVGWWRQTNSETPEYHGIEIRPTHWMPMPDPLPEPPESLNIQPAGAK